MWLSQKKLTDPRWEDRSAETGSVTISDPLSVMLDSEVRQVPIAAPGGYLWRPSVGQSLLIIKCGEDDHIAVAAESAPVAGSTSAVDLREGEVCIVSDGGAEVYLRNDGSIRLSGNASFSGDLVVDGDVKITGDLSVTGTARVSSLYVNGVKYVQPS